jgi:hypothetical protein
LTREPQGTEQAVVRVLEAQPDLWQLYGGWLVSGHPAVSEELARMARAKAKPSEFFDLRPLVKLMGWPEFFRRTGLKDVVDEQGLEALVSQLTPKQRRELLRRLQETPSQSSEE